MLTYIYTNIYIQEIVYVCGLH